MRVLVSESKDKVARKVINIPKQHLIQLLQIDNGYHEVIPMEDPSLPLRVYFDIEDYNKDDMLQEVLTTLNNVFKTNNDDWAISCGSRKIENDYKISYHIMSKKYKMSLNDLRSLSNKLDKPYIDNSAYWFSMNYCYDEGSLRLPNQSKSSINKEGVPMKILQGEIQDFFVTQTEGLELFNI
jgi:hypothetical protein